MAQSAFRRRNLARRRIVGGLGVGLALLCAIIGAACLLIILGYVIVQGAGALNRADGAAILRLAARIADDTGMIGPAGSPAEGGWNGFNILHTAASRVAARLGLWRALHDAVVAAAGSRAAGAGAVAAQHLR